mgnify:FL=1
MVKKEATLFSEVVHTIKFETSVGVSEFDMELASDLHDSALDLLNKLRKSLSL